MTLEKELKEQVRVLKLENKRLREKPNPKEFFIKKIAKEIFKEKATTTVKYKFQDEEKSYEKLINFYEILSRSSKEFIVELYEKLKKLGVKK